MECFIGKEEDLEGDTRGDGEPVEFDSGGGNMIATFEGGKDRADEGVLDKLKAMEGAVWQLVEEGIAVVEVGVHEGIC